MWQKEGAVEFLGYCSDMLPIYQASDVVCLPSYREGLPKALIEGASVGKALVATDVPGCREVVRDGVNGFLVSLGDSVGLAKALECLVEDEELRLGMGNISRHMVLSEGFGEEYIVQSTLKVYGALLKQFNFTLLDQTEVLDFNENYLN